MRLVKLPGKDFDVWINPDHVVWIRESWRDGETFVFLDAGPRDGDGDHCLVILRDVSQVARVLNRAI